jgi:hypothetical protein
MYAIVGTGWKIKYFIFIYFYSYFVLDFAFHRSQSLRLYLESGHATDSVRGRRQQLPRRRRLSGNWWGLIALRARRFQSEAVLR